MKNVNFNSEINHDAMLTLARAFLLSEGEERVAMARAMLALMDT